MLNNFFNNIYNNPNGFGSSPAIPPQYFFICMQFSTIKKPLPNIVQIFFIQNRLLIHTRHRPTLQS